MIVLPKIFVESHLETDEDRHNYNGRGLINDNVITYVENDTKVKIDLKNLVLTRDNKDMHLMLYFKENKANISIKEINQELSLNLEVLKIIKNDDSLIINYKIDMNTYHFTIKWKIGDE